MQHTNEVPSHDAPARITADNYFATVPEWVLYDGLSSRAVHVYAVLQRWVNNERGVAFPGNARLAKHVGTSVKTIQRALDELADAGAIVMTAPPRKAESKAAEWAVITHPPSRTHARPPRAPMRDPSRTSAPQTERVETEQVSEDKNITSDVVPTTDPVQVGAEFEEPVQLLTRQFAKAVRENGHAWPGTDKGKRQWYVEMDRLLRLGPPGDTPGDAPDVIVVESVLDWALTQSSFWPANIRSVGKFREQFTVLAGQMRREHGSGNGEVTGLGAVQRFLNNLEENP